MTLIQKILNYEYSIMTTKPKLSVYCLTFNSEKYLPKVLKSIARLADELIVIDSGSTDNTKKIAAQFGAVWIHRDFDDYCKQRNFSIDQCKGEWILSIDDDEIMDTAMLDYLLELKTNNFALNGKTPKGYGLRRFWYVEGKKVRSFYPTLSPDHMVRLFKKTLPDCYYDNSIVHVGQTRIYDDTIDVSTGALHHYTCDNVKLLFSRNLKTHAARSALDMVNQVHNGARKLPKWKQLIKVYFSPIAAWRRWYWRREGYKDGRIGWYLGLYAMAYTHTQYKIAYRLLAKGRLDHIQDKTTG